LKFIIAFASTFAAEARINRFSFAILHQICVIFLFD